MKVKIKTVFFVIAALGLLFMVLGCLKAGMSGDEHVHQTQAEHIYDFYRTFGKDNTAAVVTDNYNLPLYGQAVDNFSYAVCRWFGIKDIMLLRHIINSICGWLTILFTSLIAFRAAGKNYIAAIITFLLFIFSPRFVGHSFNNLKDVDLAAFMAMGLYYMLVFLQDFPKVKTKTAVMLAVSIGLAMAVRVGGLILIAYFGLFGLIRYIVLARTDNGFEGMTKGKAFGRLLVYGVLISLCGYLLCVLLWPYAMKDPFGRIFGALAFMNKFSMGLRQLYEGKLIWSYDLPWYYTPKFIFTTIPVAVIIGALIATVLGWKKQRAFATSFLLFCFVFPVFWIVYTKANVYGGWRHSIFCYPTLVALAGVGFHNLGQCFKKERVGTAVSIGLSLVLLIGPIRHTFANHPYEYVYFNELAGGTRNAFGKYEMDYYYHSTREGVEWIINHADTTLLPEGGKYKIATWHTPSVQYYVNRHDSVHFKSVFSRIYQMGNNDWDYAVFTVTGMNPDWITNAQMFPPVNTVHTVKVDGVPICIVLERKDRNDLYAYRAMEAGRADSAVMLYLKALEYNPYNEQALENISELYLRLNRPDSAYIYANRWYENVPSNMSAMVLMCNVYFAQNNYNAVRETAQQIRNLYPKEVSGYWYAAHAYLRENNLQGALNELQALIKVQQYKPAYELMAQIYQAVGENTAARQCLSIASQLR